MWPQIYCTKYLLNFLPTIFRKGRLIRTAMITKCHGLDKDTFPQRKKFSEYSCCCGETQQIIYFFSVENDSEMPIKTNFILIQVIVSIGTKVIQSIKKQVGNEVRIQGMEKDGRDLSISDFFHTPVSNYHKTI
jgi:hypothetical protein